VGNRDGGEEFFPAPKSIGSVSDPIDSIPKPIVSVADPIDLGMGAMLLVGALHEARCSAQWFLAGT
jgi:hypothetical protein